jgi:Mrp family chromosome partitioning ATPase
LLESDQQLRDIRRLIIEELGRIQAGIANEYQTAQTNVAALQKRVQILKNAAIASNEDRVRLDELQRDVDARRTVYDRFLRARDTVREQAVDAPVGRVIAPARIPTAPSSPKSFAIVALSLAAGFGFGVAAALGADLAFGSPLKQRSVPSAQLVEASPPALTADPHAVPVLGYVPSPFGNPATLTDRAWLVDRFRTAWPTAMEIEHVPSLPVFRSAIQSLGLLGGDGEAAKPRALAVTSIGTRDSRTTLALGLAEAAAAHGLRAVVIDADEKGSLLRDLVTAEARPTLVDLMGTTRICYRVVAPFRGSLSIVPIVSTEAQIARRLVSRGTSARLDGIASNFDLVIFDGPALSEVDRIEAIAATVDTLVVAAPKASTRESIEAAVRQLELPMGSAVTAVLVADLAEGATASEAA